MIELTLIGVGVALLWYARKLNQHKDGCGCLTAMLLGGLGILVLATGLATIA